MDLKARRPQASRQLNLAEVDSRVSAVARYTRLLQARSAPAAPGLRGQRARVRYNDCAP